MHPDTRQVAAHMKEFSFNILGRAIYDATFSEMTKPFAHALSIVHAAHGAEILLKARIAQEHPLLIFEAYPKSKTTASMLNIKELFDYGKTLVYPDLPEAIWATIGYRMKRVEDYQRFGNLRNGIVHFAALNFDATKETFKFLFEVMDPIAFDFWGETFIFNAIDWDDDIIAGGYLREQINRHKLKIRPALRKEIKQLET